MLEWLGFLALVGIALAWAYLVMTGDSRPGAGGGEADDDPAAQDDKWTNPDRWLERNEAHPPGRPDWLHTSGFSPIKTDSND